MFPIIMESGRRIELSAHILRKLEDRECLEQELLMGKLCYQILEISPDQLEQMYQAAHVFLEKKIYLDAADAFVFLVTLHPQESRFWLGLGLALQSLQEFDGAVDAYEMAALCQIFDPTPYFYLAKCLFALHEREATLQALDLAIEYAGDLGEYQEIKQNALEARALFIKNCTQEMNE